MNQLNISRIINATPKEAGAILADEICKASKLNQWFSFMGVVNGKAVGIKGYGKWLQIFKIDGVEYGAPEFKTQKALKEYVIESITPAYRQYRKMKDYLMKGNGIYSSDLGGRYFDCRVNDSGKLECFDGYASETRAGWIEFESTARWHGPHGETVFI